MMYFGHPNLLGENDLIAPNTNINVITAPINANKTVALLHMGKGQRGTRRMFDTVNGIATQESNIRVIPYLYLKGI